MDVDPIAERDHRHVSDSPDMAAANPGWGERRGTSLIS
jgi:hypothetical protein